MTFPYGRMPMVCSLKTSLRCGGRARGRCPEGWAFGGAKGRSLPRSGGRSNQRAARSSPTGERGGGESRGCGQTRQHAQGIPVTLRIRTCRICTVDTVFDPSGAHVNSVESDSAVRCKHGELESSRGQVSSLLVRRGIEIPSRLWIEASDGLTCRSARGAPPQRPPVVRSLRPALQPGAQRRIGGVRPAGR